MKILYENKWIDVSKEVVAYCWMGLHASHSYMILRLLGFPHVRVYDASLSELQKIGSDVGFTDLESPVMRHAAKLASIKEAAGLMGADVEHLVVRLNQCIQAD